MADRITDEFYTQSETDSYGTFRVRVLRDEPRHYSDGDSIAVVTEFTVEVRDPREWDDPQFEPLPVQGAPNISFPSSSSRGTSPTLAWYMAAALKEAVSEANRRVYQRADEIRHAQRELARQARQQSFAGDDLYTELTR